MHSGCMGTAQFLHMYVVRCEHSRHLEFRLSPFLEEMDVDWGRDGVRVKEGMGMGWGIGRNTVEEGMRLRWGRGGKGMGVGMG